MSAAEIFTGERFGPETTERLYRELLFDKRSIVLTGMPGCGKSTLGALLARRRRTGMPITEIFRTHGEAYFRDLETEVLRTAGLTGGRVIAAGGGAVLRPENVDTMKQNGTVVFLDRPLDGLRPTADRPLADDAEKLRRLYETRRPTYTAAADVTVPVRGTPEQTAETVLERLR